MLCNNFKARYSHFLRRKPNVPTSSQNKHKQTMSILSTQQRFFSAVSAGGSKVIPYGKNTQRLVRWGQRSRTSHQSDVGHQCLVKNLEIARWRHRGKVCRLRLHLICVCILHCVKGKCEWSLLTFLVLWFSIKFLIPFVSYWWPQWIWWIAWTAVDNISTYIARRAVPHNWCILRMIINSAILSGALPFELCTHYIGVFHLDSPWAISVWTVYIHNTVVISEKSCFEHKNA